MPSLKPKKCKDCKDEFQPFKSMQPRCVPCAIKKGKTDNAKRVKREKKNAEKSFNAETRRRKAKLKGKSEHKREAQAAFNAFIRKRDEHLGCISCGNKPNDSSLMTGSRWDAGHYRSRGSTPELAFEELNCHKQCVRCNSQLSGNVTNYRISLAKKIGLDKLEWLEGPHKLTRHTIDDYIAIKKKYREKLKFITQST